MRRKLIDLTKLCCVGAMVSSTTFPVLGADFTYGTNPNGTIRLLRYTGNGGAVAVPATLDGKPVTVIGNGCFGNCAGLVSVTLPDSVTAIEDGNLSGVGGDASWPGWVPLGVGCPPGAFSGCTNLVSVTLGRNMTDVGDYSFALCKALKEVTIPDTVTRVGNGAFAGCVNLEKVVIGKGVEQIGMQAFEQCGRLAQVQIGSGVVSIGAWAFQACSSLANVDIPDRVIDIGHGAFRRCQGLKTVTVGSGVKTVGRYVFSGCPNLTEIYFRGNAPSEVGSSLFFRTPEVKVYCSPAASGWKQSLSGRPVSRLKP